MNVDTFSFMIGQDLQSEQLDFVKSLGLKKSNPLNVLDEGFRLIGQGYNLISDESTDPEMFKYELRDTKKRNTCSSICQIYKNVANCYIQGTL